eukprot:RCo034437
MLPSRPACPYAGGGAVVCPQPRPQGPRRSNSCLPSGTPVLLHSPNTPTLHPIPGNLLPCTPSSNPKAGLSPAAAPAAQLSANDACAAVSSPCLRLVPSATLRPTLSTGADPHDTLSWLPSPGAPSQPDASSSFSEISVSGPSEASPVGAGAPEYRFPGSSGGSRPSCRAGVQAVRSV